MWGLGFRVYVCDGLAKLIASKLHKCQGPIFLSPESIGYSHYYRDSQQIGPRISDCFAAVFEDRIRQLLPFG